MIRWLRRGIIDGRLGDRPHCLVRPARLAGQVEPVDAAIAAVGPTLDPAVLLHTIEHPAGTGAIDLEHHGELGLAGAGAAIEPGQDEPLGAGQADVTDAPVEHRPHQARDVRQDVADILVVVWPH
jgi:hypothetical protein